MMPIILPPFLIRLRRKICEAPASSGSSCPQAGMTTRLARLTKTSVC